MSNEILVVLREVRQSLVETAPEPWSNISALIQKATPIIRAFCPEDYDGFEKAIRPPHPAIVARGGRIGQPYDFSQSPGADSYERAANKSRSENAKHRILSFIDGLIIATELRQRISQNQTTTMPQNPTEQNLLAVMSAMNQLATGSGGGAYSNDTAIAKATGFSLQEVQDYMDILADSHLTSPSNSATGRCAALSAHGRTKLRDSGYNPAPSFGNIIVQGNQGVVMNIGSVLQNVTQTINQSPYMPQDKKEQLAALVEELKEQLSQVPSENAEDAEAVAETAKALVENASKEKPNKSLLNISASGLKEAAKSLAAVAPTVFEVAMKIVALTQGGVA